MDAETLADIVDLVHPFSLSLFAPDSATEALPETLHIFRRYAREAKKDKK